MGMTKESVEDKLMRRLVKDKIVDRREKKVSVGGMDKKETGKKEKGKK